MKRNTLLVIGFLGSLAATSAVATESSYGAADSTGRPADGQQTREGARATDRGSVPVAAGESAGGKGSAAVGRPQPAGTGTAAKHIYDQVKKGNIKIQGATDADIYQ